MISSEQRFALAKLLTAVQNGAASGAAAASSYRYTGPRAPVVAVTGPPGAGKSSLMNLLALHWAQAGEKVAVLAIDPSSPFSGGAVLGDRIRANAATSHPGVFMRSLSARNSLEQQTLCIVDSCAVLSAFGFDRVLVETVGAGQMSLEALDLADCILGVSVPGLGDEVQLSKAGILEIADVHVVNKADLDGAKRLASGLEGMLALAYPRAGQQPDRARYAQPGFRALVERHGDPAQEAEVWLPPVVQTSAVRQTNVAQAAAAVESFLAWTSKWGRDHSRYLRRLRLVIEVRLKLALAQRFEEEGKDSIDRLVSEIANGRSDPAAAVSTLLDQHNVAGA